MQNNNLPTPPTIHNNDQQHNQLKSYYQSVHQQLQKTLQMDTLSTTTKNKFKSYLVTLLKGNQHLRQVPKDLKRQVARQLRLLAIDRSLSESMCQFSELEKKAMNQYANGVNQEREREGGFGFGDALRDLVRLARMNNMQRQQISSEL